MLTSDEQNTQNQQESNLQKSALDFESSMGAPQPFDRKPLKKNPQFARLAQGGGGAFSNII